MRSHYLVSNNIIPPKRYASIAITTTSLILRMCQLRRDAADHSLFVLALTHLFLQLICQISFTMLILFLLLATAIANHRQLQVVHQVIVIGAGAAGIGASATLTQNNVDHIILQARDRIGGRVWAAPLGTSFINTQMLNPSAAANRTNGTSESSSAGRGIDFGAAYVFSSYGQNAINPLVDDLSWGRVLTNFSNTQVFYQRPYSLTPNQSALATLVYQQFVLFATRYVTLQGDTDLQTTWDRFVVSFSYTNNTNSSTTNLTNQTSAVYDQTILNRVYFYLAQQTNLNGADITFLSTNAFLRKPSIGQQDYTPTGSYAQLLTAIVERYSNNTQIIYNEFVSEIDYSGPAVKITTRNKNIYYAPKVIITVPLGLLQAKNVTFIPQLPLDYQNVINSMGNGVLNKIVIQLNTSFWTNNAVLLQFINAIGKPIVFPEAIVYPDPNNNILTFYVSGNTSRVLNSRTDAQIVSLLVSLLPEYINTNQSISVSNLYTVTRWEQDPYSLGSFAFFTPNTLVSNMTLLLQPVDNRIWLAGEHVHPNQTGTVQGAYQTGVWAAQSSSEWWMMSVWVVLMLLVHL